MNIIAQTPRLLIRQYQSDEEDLYVVLHKDEQVLQYIPRRSEEENRKLFKETLIAYDGNTGLGRWGIFDATEGVFIGACLLRNFSLDPEKIELGYSFHVRYWGKGFATEMAKAMINYGFKTCRFTTLCAVTHPDNQPSQNVLLKAGMQQLDDVLWEGQTVPYFEVKRN